VAGKVGVLLTGVDAETQRTVEDLHGRTLPPTVPGLTEPIREGAWFRPQRRANPSSARTRPPLPAVERQLNDLKADRESAQLMDAAGFVITGFTELIHAYHGVRHHVPRLAGRTACGCRISCHRV
ncbi:MAG: hypothetical protein QOE54_2174, partial [Streptosporangiaceae bacterium]|nr:hypothetical protein [Streptosporangiaceae bacterium]